MRDAGGCSEGLLRPDSFSYFRPLVIVGKDLLIGFPLFCHTVSAVLAHADAVTGTAGGKGNAVSFHRQCEAGGVKPESASDICAGDGLFSDSACGYPSAGRAGTDLYRRFGDFSKVQLGKSFFHFFCKLIESEGDLFFFMGSARFIGAVNADQIRKCTGKDIL